MIRTVVLATLGATLVAKSRERLSLSRAKHRSLAGHPRMARRLAALLPPYDHGPHRFFRVDDPPQDIVVRRQAGFSRLAALYRERFARSLALTSETRAGLSDLQFTGSYRVPFQFAPFVRQHLPVGAFVQSSQGVTVTDLDGNRFIDLTGSYGANLLGYDVYKACIADAVEQAGPIGPVLGQYHPVVADNVARLRAISGLDEVSFHMSGTEAVMQAVRLAQYHTGRSHLVRFAGAYHGWWGDVQPGPGNPVPANHTYTLAEMSQRTLDVLATRKDIACVLVNPLQALHPNKAAPGDGTLVGARELQPADRHGYAAWLRQLGDVCAKRGIVLILDEVFTGFRLAAGGAKAYFGIAPDLITYGKTLGGGLPVGVLCGLAPLMKRFREDRPGDICFARGTFNAHPYVMAAMNAFLRRIETPEVRGLYADERWNRRAATLNRRLAQSGLPLRVINLSTIWTVLHLAPSRYNWMLQFYLRAEGLALSWVGTGRIIFSLNFGDAEFEQVCDRFLAAGERMRDDGWWHTGPNASSRSIARAMVRETLASRRLKPGRSAPP
jgi:glutamate-1-semialdehyde 2,1-aminomutase